MTTEQKSVEHEFRIEKLESSLSTMAQTQAKDTHDMMLILKNIEKCLIGNLDGNPGIMEEVREMKKTLKDHEESISTLTKDITVLKDNAAEVKGIFSRYKWLGHTIGAGLLYLLTKVIELSPHFFK